MLELEFVFKARFLVNEKNYPYKWKVKQIVDAETESYYENPKDYIELLVDEDDWSVSIKPIEK